MFLNPSRLHILAGAEQHELLDSHHVMDCFECGSCAYVCPSNIPLVQWIRLGKVVVRSKQAPPAPKPAPAEKPAEQSPAPGKVAA